MACRGRNCLVYLRARVLVDLVFFLTAMLCSYHHVQTTTTHVRNETQGYGTQVEMRKMEAKMRPQR